ATAVAQQKVPLKVCTPTLIGRPTLSKGFAIRSHPSPPLACLYQSRSLQDFARRGIRRPLKFRRLLAQPVQHLFRAPFLPLQLGLHNQAAQLLSGLIGMSVRRAFQFLESWQPMLLVTPYPLVSRRPANPIDSAKLAFAVISTQPICYQLNSLVHRTGFLPRHRHPPPGRCNVNHVPGLFCKRSYRFVPTPALSQRERELIYSFTPKPLISVETIDSAKLRAMRITAGSSSLKKLRGSLANSNSPRKTKF